MSSMNNSESNSNRFGPGKVSTIGATGTTYDRGTGANEDVRYPKALWGNGAGTYQLRDIADNGTMLFVLDAAGVIPNQFDRIIAQGVSTMVIWS